MPPLGMRTLIQRLLVATVVSVVAVGLLVGQWTTEEIKKTAEQGDANAQVQLGLSYFSAQGTARDYDEAKKWYRKATKRGHAGCVRNGLSMSHNILIYQEVMLD